MSPVLQLAGLRLERGGIGCRGDVGTGGYARVDGGRVENRGLGESAAGLYGGGTRWKTGSKPEHIPSHHEPISTSNILRTHSGLIFGLRS